MPGTPRSESGSRESDAEPDVLLEILEDASRIPEWAPAFADIVVRDGPSWRATKDGRDFSLRVAALREAGTVDYLREVAPGRIGGAYLRVVPRSGGGSVVAMTLPVRPGVDPAEVRETLARELAALVGLAA
jgi:hypothetical protein